MKQKIDAMIELGKAAGAQFIGNLERAMKRSAFVLVCIMLTVVTIVVVGIIAAMYTIAIAYNQSPLITVLTIVSAIVGRVVYAGIRGK